MSVVKRIFKNKIFRFFLTLVFWFGVWEILSLAVGKEILLPSPIVTVRHLFSLFASEGFFAALGLSITRITLGLAAGVIIGIGAATLSFLSGGVKMLLSPLKSIVKATPVASFILLAYLWLTKAQIPGFIASLIVIPVIWENTAQGLSSADKKLIECADVFKIRKSDRVALIYIPSVKPYLRAGILTSIGLAWKAGIAAETLVRTNNSLGGKLYDSKIYYETGDLFALTALIIIISVAIERLAKLLIEMRKKKGAAK